MEQLDRRRFLRRAGAVTGGAGALWVTPSVVHLDVAFAAGSGPCGAVPNLSFVPGSTGSGDGSGINSDPTMNNGWTFASAGMATGGTDALGVFANWYALSQAFVVERNPVVPVTAAQVTYTHTLGTLVAGRTYTFTFQALARTVNQYTQQMQVQVISTSAVTTLATFATGNPPAGATLFSDNTLTPVTLSFTPPASGVYQLQFVFTFPFSDAGTPNGVGDDIAITAPVVTCA